MAFVNNLICIAIAFRNPPCGQNPTVMLWKQQRASSAALSLAALPLGYCTLGTETIPNTFGPKNNNKVF